MKFKRHLEEAVITPIPINWRDIKGAIEAVYDNFEIHHKDWVARDLHENLSWMIKKSAAWLNVELKHDPKIKDIAGSTTINFIKKGRKWEVEPKVTIKHNMGTTFEKWRVNLSSKIGGPFKWWLTKFESTAYHEMVHAGQLWKIWQTLRIKNPFEFELILARQVGKFSQWLDDKQNYLITNYEKYHADSLEIMAFAQGAAIDLWKYGESFKQSLADDQVFRSKAIKGSKELKALAETGDIKKFVIDRLKKQSYHSSIALQSDSFMPYWKMKKKYPKVWKKFLKYIVEYLEHHGNI